MFHELVSKALHYYAEGNRAEAESLCRGVLTSPDSIDKSSQIHAAHLLGVIMLERGDVGSSLPILRYAAASSIFDSNIRHNYGVALMRAGKVEDAIACFHHALALDSRSLARPHPPVWRDAGNGALVLDFGFVIDKAYAESARIHSPAIDQARA